MTNRKIFIYYPLKRGGFKPQYFGNLPLDEIGREVLAERIIRQPPQQGYITISNALQWRLQYRRIIEQAVIGNVIGVENILS
ncbi:hypothetical protein [Hydrocoleum sp. CS-953]|uniref:hypothetical protein n=1 Tax=Hydrocoleum sp. CS-953 TaxID=1671698 RepID=UPI001FEDC925|nr:hypothetical protein [Hydrocoleum sp. CS-953]